jgi:hypothetical protein
MQPQVKTSSTFSVGRLDTLHRPGPSSEVDAREEMNRSLLELLGEVIRMSQAWVRALESGDPFTAEKCEAECILAMERFEAERNSSRSLSESLEQTR